MGIRGRNKVIGSKINKEESLHSKYVNLAYRWILNNTSCGVAFKEFKTANTEIPDVIGFGSWGHSVLIEVKTSKTDFVSDSKKFFRQYPIKGMGSQRFYFCPKGMITKDELPSGWGLIWVDEKDHCRTMFSPYKGNIGERCKTMEKDIRAEHILLYSALRRLHLRGLLDKVYEPINTEQNERH